MQENHGPDSEGKPSEVNPPAPGPVAPGQRLAAVDVLRGFALLGILVLNIEFFALPKGIYFDPRIAGGFTGLDLLAWKGSYVLFLEKFMSIFSMLFGAGLVLMSSRLETAGRPVRWIYYRRLLWLLLFGLAHGYLLWYGDILYSYAVAGLLLFPLRRKSPRFLAIAGILILALGGLMQTGTGLFFEEMRRQATALEGARAAGKQLTPSQEGLLAGWAELAAQFKEPPEKAAQEIRTYRGSYGGIVRFRAPVALMMQTRAMIFLVLWRALGLMLLGMALMKSGVFSAQRTMGFYTTWAVLGYGIGLPLCGYGAATLIAHDFDFVHRFKIGGLFNHVGSVLVALAHASIVMIVVKKRRMPWLTRRLAAVGRTALSNYLLHSIVFTTIFYGYGLGLFGRINRFPLLGFVVAMWVLQLFLAPWWVERFRFGPFEWLWRSLTYWKRQPLRMHPSRPE